MVMLDIFVAQLVLFLKRLDDAIGLLGNNLSSVYNLLTFLNDTTRQSDTRQQVVLAGLTTFSVVNDIRSDIFVEVTLL